MNELALFAGAGGGILASKMLGWRTVCAVERDAYAAAILAQRQNDGLLEAFPVWSDVTTFDGTRWKGIVDIVSGGFPCQDISNAGLRKGIKGQRSGLWSEMVRIIGEVRPEYVFAENVSALTIRGLDTVLSNLAEMGFNVEWGCLSASDVGANHKRERIWILANSENKRTREDKRGVRKRVERIGGRQETNTGQQNILSYSEHNRDRRREQLKKSITKKNELAHSGCKHDERDSKRVETNKAVRSSGKLYAESGSKGQIPDTTSKRSQRQGKLVKSLCSTKKGIRETTIIKSISRPEQWATEPDVGRVANGVAFRVDRLKAIGNGQVPLCAAEAFKQLKRRLDGKITEK